ncbi:MAG: phosphodiester glycosidase family protein, partial [FCB group bacterium]|nr:phosphodiester glycosidase family protein [FCB group bacterium]
VSYPNESIGTSHCADRHPRTAIGFNQDSTKVYFVVVDGRQAGYSVGMSLYEMAAFMKDIGIAHAVNLDGGGSSSMVVRNYVMNKPSDGSERSVSNGIICVSTAPVGDLKHIVFERDSVALYKNKTLAIGPMGWDEHYNPKAITDWGEVHVTYNTDLGTFLEGNFTASEEHGTTTLTAIYDQDTSTIIIHVIDLDELEIFPKYAMTDYSKTIKFSLTAMDEDDIRKSFRNDLFRFEILDPEVGTINEAGDFTATAPGLARIVAYYGVNTDTAFVTVEIGQGTMALDEIEDMNDYSVSADQYIDMDSTSIVLVDRTAGAGSKAMQINYKYAGGSEDGNIYLEHDPVTLYGLPSEIQIDVLGDNLGHWVYVLLEDAGGKEYSARTTVSLLFDDDYRTLVCPMNSLLPYDRAEVYPMTYKGIRFRVNRKATSGTVYLDYIRLLYPEWTSVEKNHDTGIPANFNLKQNYPNPFNPITHISYELSEPGQISLDIFNVSGKYVLTLVNEYQMAGYYTVRFNAEKLPTGIYYYRLTDGSQLQTKKMLLIK